MDRFLIYLTIWQSIPNLGYILGKYDTYIQINWSSLKYSCYHSRTLKIERGTIRVMFFEVLTENESSCLTSQQK